GRAVALKVIAEQPDEASVARFRREARAASALSHPNVATVFDVGTHEGSPYLVMELLDGHAMRRYVGDREIEREKKLAWLRDIARALDAAHRAGLVHRDVKPDNVMVTSSGTAKLLDFGIARPAVAPIDPTAPTTQGASTNLTQAGKMVGSPFYMAPEQLKGDVADARSDQFAWGVTAYELLSGELPWGFEPTPFALAAKMLNEDARPLDARDAEADPRAVEVVMRALSRAPEERFASMAEVIAALGGTPAEGIAAPPRRTGDPPVAEGKTAEGSKPARSIPIFPIAIAAAVVLIGVWLVPSILRDVRGPNSEPKKGEPILGLSDSVTREREAELDKLIPKTAPSASAGTVVRKCREKDGCSDGNTPWCIAERKVACCAPGLVGSAAGRCECAPGGTLDKALIDGGCKQGEPKTGAPIQKVVREHFDAFRACYETALTKNPKISGKVSIEFDIAPDGSAYDGRLAGASVPDPVFQDCLVQEVSKLRFSPPLDGHTNIIYPLDFSPGNDTK
ncbi:MAG: protein kinase, partial [Polyangiaceae bacterium]|nr:protein kinase [Polyangiaceae bacterium]